MEANNKAMREALLCILDIAARDMPNYCRSRARDQGETESIRAWSNTIVEIAKNALSKPFRQCDVGTAEEQTARYDKFCRTNRTVEKCCTDCPALGVADCEFVWAQMPYKGGETNGNQS